MASRLIGIAAGIAVLATAHVAIAAPHLRGPSIPFILPGSEFARSTAIGDIDGDGLPDVVVASTNGLRVYHQGPGLTFTGPDQYLPGADLEILGIANADGVAGNDVIVAQTNDATLTYTLFTLRNSGAVLTPSAATGSEAGYVPTATAGDLNGDGFPDVAVAAMDSNEVYVFTNDGSGGFGAPTDLPSGITSPNGVQIRDVNLDGKMDLVVSGADSAAVFFGTGGALAPPELSFTGGEHIFDLGTLDANPGPDAITEGNFTGAKFAAYAGGGAFTAGAQIYTGLEGIVEGKVGDFNGDGKLDCAFDEYHPGADVKFLYGDGAGHFSDGPELPSGAGPIGMSVGDLDGDGASDVMIASQGGGEAFLYLGRVNGTVGTPVTHWAAIANDLVLADLDGDGKLDAVMPDRLSGAVAAFKGAGDGSFILAGSQSAGAGAWAVAAGLLNGDGSPDVLATTPGALKVFLNDGSGNLLAPTSVVIDGTPRVIATGDLDNDGKLDLALPASLSGTTDVLVGDGLGGFTAKPSLVAASGTVAGAAIARFDNDANADLAISNGAQVLVYGGHGDGTFAGSPLVLPYPSSNLGNLVAADVDGDGHADLLACPLSGSALSTVAYWHNNGAGGFDAVVNIETRSVLNTNNSYTPYKLVVADFDGDGANDLLVTTGTRYAMLVPGTTPGSFGPPQALGGGYNGSGLAVGDLDGDGDLDVAVSGIGSTVVPSQTSTLTTLVNDQNLVAVPRGTPAGTVALALRSLAPNPTTGAFTIRYALPAAGAVRVDLVSVSGRRIESFTDAPSTAGEHVFALAPSRRLAAGVYSVIVSQGDARVARKVVVLQ